MNPFEANPFAVLTLIAAPAVLTNASSVLALGTSNRFARAIDRSRSLVSDLEGKDPATDPVARLRIRQMERTETRAILLLRALSLFYLALGCFAATSLISVLGGSLASTIPHAALVGIMAVALGVGTLAVFSLAYGCVILLRDTRLAVQNVHEESALLREKYRDFMAPDGVGR